ncbi:Molybdopterin oxidoreductase Fe4S4 domain-containing protein [Salinibacillus kushneri]|uniref:Molybdopterin oxidoreductase Fe4S4 domain-containing protein n=1 Tax=Salinibacillus kushneri TaxID=237682 RepID=A0A1I0F2Y1_9BACI|nr:molybdopterin oxidoreductase family protein [Salinibacillus kushneri]SET51364.1 Molybdopterin oxidoreductase Fe4S4 domain-containing protein [Salinibacillus kushneri]
MDINLYSQGDVNKWVYSTCNICSIGCGCYIGVKDNKIVGIKGNEDHDINRGRLDPKGENQWYANNSPDRLLTPLIRKDGTLQPASWDEAMNLIVTRTKETLRTIGSDGIAFYSTGQGTLETYYTIAKVGRAGLRSHLLDANTRLCTATTEWCLFQSFGADGVPASFEDVDLTDTIMFFGHNPAETGTVFFERIMERKRRTGKPYIIVVDVRKTLTAKEADLFLQLKPGTNLALLNGIVHLLLKNGWIDKDFIREHTVGFERIQWATEPWTPSLAAKVTGIPEHIMEMATHVIGTTNSLVCTTLQGAYQSADATSSCVAINNIHLIRGLIGKPGSGPLHMAGQPSSSGNRTVGGVGTYPGNRNPGNPKHIKEMAELWNVNTSDLEVGPEKGIEEIVHLMEKGKVGLFWNINTNPMASLPNRQRAKKAFENTFVVVQDPFLTETTEVADVVLPPAIWGEKEGTMENADRTINLLTKAVDPPNGVKSDFDILLDFAKRMGFKTKDGKPLITYETPEQCFEEWKKVSKGRPSDMSAATYEKLKENNGLRWPIDEKHPLGTPRLYSDFKFHTFPDNAQTYGKDLFTGRPRTKEEFESMQANGRAILYDTHYVPSVEQPRQEYPFWLTTGRLVWHWHTRTKTGRSPYLQMIAPEGYVEINIVDAESLGIIPGELVKVSSPRGSINVPARVVDTVQPGLVFIPFHYGTWENNQSANELTVDFTDPLSKQPTFKQCSCKIEPVRNKITISEKQTFEDIAETNALSLEELAKINHMIPPYRADIGDQIEVPLSRTNVEIPPYMPYRNIQIFPHFSQAELPFKKE